MKRQSRLNAIVQVGSGRLIGQVATFAAAPILSRIYSPEEYGVSGLVVSLATIGMTVATLRYDQKVLTVRSDRARANLFLLSAISILLVSGLAGMMLLAVSLLDVAILPQQSTVSWLLVLIPLFIVIGAVFNQLMPSLLVALGFYWLVSAGALVAAAGGAIIQVILGLTGFGPSGLVVGRLAGMAAGLGVMLSSASRAWIKKAYTRSQPRTIWRLAKAHKAQAVILSPADLVNTTTAFLPVFMFQHLFGPGIAGSYFFMFSLVGMGVRLYSSTIRPVIIREMAGLPQTGEAAFPVLLRLTGVTTAMALVGFSLMFFFGGEIVVFLFGREWETAGTMLVIMGLYYSMAFVHIPIAGLVSLYNFQKIVLITEVAQFFAGIVALSLGLLGTKLPTILWVMSVSWASIYLISMIFMFLFIRRMRTALL